MSESSKLCSEHFKPDDFDRTGQILVFNFPCHLQCIFTLHANRDVYDSYVKQKLISHFAKHVFTILSACLGISDVLCIAIHCGIPKPFQVFLMK